MRGRSDAKDLTLKTLLIPEYSTFGGTRSFFFKLLDIHKKNGIDTAVVLEKKQLEEVIIKKLVAADVPFYPVADRSRLAFNPFISWLFDINKIFKAYRSYRPDLMVVSNGTPGIMLGALLFPVPVLFVMHTYPERYPWPLRTLWNLFCLPEKKQFLTVSAFSASEINRNMGISRDRISVVYNGYERQLNRSNSSSPLVLTLGHVVNYKNPGGWLQVANKVVRERPGTRFVWLGDGTLLQRMRDEVEQLKLADAVFFEGYRQDVDDYFTRASIYFQPSLIENHAISLLDAMASGLACVASSAGGTPESIVDGETGFLCTPDDVDSFAARLITLIDDKELSRRMGESGRVRAEEFFSPDVQEQGILGQYAALAKSSLSGEGRGRGDFNKRV